jgi:hypothetical protein
MCCLSYELSLYREGASKLPPVGAQLPTGKGVCVVFRTELHQQAVWVRDSDGQEHRISRDMVPPGPWRRGGEHGGGARPDRGPGGNGDPPPAKAGPGGRTRR